MQANQDAKADKKWLQKLISADMILLFAGIVFILIVSIYIPRFLSFRNISSIIVQISSTGLMAIGLTFVIITSGIDLSLPPVMAFSAILGCAVMATTQNVLLGMLVSMMVATAIGCFNGLSVSKLFMVPMIVTLSVSTMAQGASNWFTEAKSISGMPEAFSQIVAGDLLGVPVPAILLILIAIFMHLLLSRTRFGRSLFAVGTNARTASVNGVKTSRIIFTTYLISGIMAGIAGLVAAARLNSAGANMGPQSMFLDIVCAVVLGGASVAGGKGTILGTVIGSIFIAIISNVMNLLNIEFFITFIIKGAIIICVTYLDVLKNSMKGRKNSYG